MFATFSNEANAGRSIPSLQVLPRILRVFLVVTKQDSSQPQEMLFTPMISSFLERLRQDFLTRGELGWIRDFVQKRGGVYHLH